ncbi:DNA-binding transcriptional regulator, MarR family [Salinihabitans flavidus]|uniref:DNA-binding transcriptional regulator, MarR family n=1 Tax=Salinihabitans flavidus TaxID=569882 RepID=A0A1H8U5V6_9RHOB|nr:MarR family transcriptional regulator [Salinihabitans flavidus]SEO98224.1 DNA-binding transcriptional regulator, MarR family [Salinihabitans flavidus]
MNGEAHVSTAEAPSKARLRLWLRLLKASRAIEAELRDRMRREFNSTLPRFDVMAALERNEQGLKMSELSGVLKVSNGNVTGIVDRLAEDGLVARVAVTGDRRASRVCLTDRGRATFATQAAAHEGWVDELFAQVPAGRAGEVAALIDGLTRPANREDER